MQRPSISLGATTSILLSTLAACGGGTGSPTSAADEAVGSETTTESEDDDSSSTDDSTSTASETESTSETDTDDSTSTETATETETETETTTDTGDELCGNAMLDPGETCDDGNATPDDGCGSDCVIECGFLCLEVGASCIPGFHAVQCASAPQPSVANSCRLATLSVDGSHIALSPETTIAGQLRHLDAMYTDPSNAVFGFAGDTENIPTGSQLVAVDVETGELTPIGPSLGAWIMGAAMNDDGDLWVTVFDTYELNQTTAVSIAQIDPGSGEFIDGPTLLTENGAPLTVWSTHVSDVAFRFDGAMFISANEPGPPPPEPLSRYLEVDPTTATVLSSVEGPDDLYAAGIVFVGEAETIVAMDIRVEDDIYLLDLSAPPDLDATLLYPDPIPTNSGTADLAGCSTLDPQ